MRRFALVAVVCLAATVVVAQDKKPAGGQPRVGVVDMAVLFEGYPRKGVLEDQVNAERATIRKELEDHQAELRRMKSEFDRAPGPESDPDAWGARRDAVRMAQTDYEQRQDRLQARLKRRVSALTRQVTAELMVAIAETARAEGLGLVLKIDPAGGGTDEEQIFEAQCRDVLFREDALDVTKLVAARAAAPEFLQRMEKSPPGGKRF